MLVIFLSIFDSKLKCQMIEYFSADSKIVHVKGDRVRMIQEEGSVDIGQDFIHPSTGQLSGDCSSGETDIHGRIIGMLHIV